MDRPESLLTPSIGGPEVAPARDGRIRVLFSITHFDTGGVQVQLALRLEHLDRRRFACKVIVLTGGESYLLDRVRAAGVPVECLGIEHGWSLWRKVARIRRAIAEFQPDVVDGLLGWDYTYTNVAATLAGVPWIVAELQNERRGIRRSYPRWFRLFERLALACFCDRIVCCADAVRRSYRNVAPGFESRSLVIHDAIDSTGLEGADRARARRAAGIGPGRIVVATLGRFVEQKDHETLIEAAAIVRSRRSDVVFVIAGFGPLAPRAQRLVADRGLGDVVRIAGESTDPGSVYAAADIFVLTSRWEGFPVALLEAMAAGRPVVSTDVGGIGEVVAHGRTGLLCRPGDVDAIASAILDLAADPELRGRLGARGRDAVAGRFAIQRLIARWEAIYTQAPARRAAAAIRLMAADPASESGEHGSAAPRFQQDRATGLFGASPTPGPERVGSMLVWRLCPLDRFRQIVVGLRAAHPRARIDCVCQSDAAESLAAVDGSLGLSTCGTGRFTLVKLGLSHLLRLRSRRYDIVLLPYNTPDRRRYLQAEIAALVAGRGRVRAVAAWQADVRLLPDVTWASIVRFRTARALRAPIEHFRSGLVLACGILRGGHRHWLVRPSGGGAV